MVAVTHTKTTSKSGTSDNTLVQPSDWNASHTFVTSTGNVVLGVNGGAGAVTENSCLAWAFAFIAAADLPTAMNNAGVGGFSTGDVKLTLKTVADTGWVLMNDSGIGDASSGAAYANANAQALFTLLYNNIADADAPIVTQGGAGTTRGAQGTAATAWAAHCRVILPLVLGRALAGAGTGAGLSARALGHAVGEERHTLVNTEIPTHGHTISEHGGHNHACEDASAGPTYGGDVNGIITIKAGTGADSLSILRANNSVNMRNIPTSTVTTGININAQLTDGADPPSNVTGGQPHNVMQPSVFLNVMIKL